METEIIRTIIDGKGQVLSIGNYWNNSGLVYKLESFEYIGDEMGLNTLINQMRDNDFDFQHVIERRV